MVGNRMSPDIGCGWWKPPTYVLNPGYTTGHGENQSIFSFTKNVHKHLVHGGQDIMSRMNKMHSDWITAMMWIMHSAF